MQTKAADDWPPSIPLLWVEFAALFVAVPIVMALAIDDIHPIRVLALLTLAALWLLARTPDFRMAEIWRGPVLGEWKLILAFTAASAVGIGALAALLIPDRFLHTFQHNPGLWLMIMALYPLFSALPQEIIFRTLYFRRYGRLFASRHVAVAVNAAVFGLAHLFFRHEITLVMTVAGGLVFAWAYLRNGSTMLVVVLHAIAGQLIFTSGLGIYFYHGAIAAG